MYNHLKDLVLRATPRPILDSLPTALSPKTALDRAVSALYDLLGSQQVSPSSASASGEPVALALAPISQVPLRPEEGEWETDEMMAALQATLQAKRSGSITP